MSVCLSVDRSSIALPGLPLLVLLTQPQYDGTLMTGKPKRAKVTRRR
jgi:hypothetical protein